MSQPTLNGVVQHLCRKVGELSESVSDRELLERFLRNRDEVAFELLVRRHERLVLGVCQRVLRNPHDAADAFQATFFLLVRKAGSIRKGEALAAWLHQSAYRVALRANGEARKRAAHESPHVDVAGLPSREPDPAHSSPLELDRLLDEELNRLPEKYRAVIALCCLEGCTYEEAARRLAVPRGTVSIWLTRARDLLRSRLVRRGVAVPVGVLTAAPANEVAAATVATTVRAALDWVAGQTTIAAASARAAALTEGVIRTMFLNRIQSLAATLLAVVFITGTGLLAVGSGAADEWTPPAVPPPPDASAAAPGGAPLVPPRKPGDGPGGGALGSSWEEIIKIAGHKGPVVTAAFTPDMKGLATGGADGNVKLWDLPAAREILQLGGDGQPIYSVKFSPDGRLLASAGQGKPGGTRVRIWDWAGREQLNSTTADDTPVNSVAFSPDGRRLFLAAGRTMQARDRVTLEKLWSADIGATLAAVVVSPDGRMVATVGGPPDPTDRRSLAGQPLILDAATGKTILSTQTDIRPVTSVAFAPDAKLLATGGTDRSVRLLDPRSGKEVHVLAGHTGAVTAVAFAPDGRRLASGGTDRVVRFWDPVTGKQVGSLTLDGPPAVVAFSPDGRLLLTVSGGMVRLWREKPGRVVEVMPPGGGGGAPARDRLDTLLQELLKLQRGDEQVLEALCLATLGRLPTDIEKRFGLKHVSQAKDRREAFADLLHQLTSTREFADHAKALHERAQQRPGK